MTEPPSETNRCRIKEQISLFADKMADIENYLTDPSRREMKFFLTVFLDKQDLKGPTDPRMGLIQKPRQPVTRKLYYENPELYLTDQLDLIERRSALGLNDCWVPSLNLIYGINPVAEAFGCQFVRDNNNAVPWAMPVCSDPDLVDTLDADLEKSPAGCFILTTMQNWRNLTQGILPLCAVPIYSPLCTTAQIMGSTEFLTALHTHPAKIHTLLDRITDLTIEWVERQYKAAGGNLRGMGQYHVPATNGVVLSDDEQVLISPTMYQEFGVPYISRISERFGGVYLHFCGGNTHNLRCLRQIPGLRGIDSQCNPAQFTTARNILGDDMLILTRVRDRPAGPKDVSSEYLNRYIELAQDTRTILWIFTDDPGFRSDRPDLVPRRLYG